MPSSDLPAEKSMYVDNEVERLRRVVVRRPGAEIERMTQHDFERLLFDDILSPDETGREHDTMVEILRGAGAEVLELESLLREAFEAAPTVERERLLEHVCECAGVIEVAPTLAKWSAERLARAVITGVYWHELESVDESLARVRAIAFERREMALGPAPNLMFMRDPCASVYDRVIRGRMATPARLRESKTVAFALRQHLGADRIAFDDDDAHRNPRYRKFEGGDLLVLSPEVLMVGCSERTTAQTIERLANEALFPNYAALERVYAVLMPEARSVMHLDTILTQVDRRMFLGHEPLIRGRAGAPGLQVVEFERGGSPRLLESAAPLDVLREVFGQEVEFVPCGGEQVLHQEREQWTDGANAVCVAPGKIILYARNRKTVAALEAKGFAEVRLSATQNPDERAAGIASGMQAERTVFSFSGSELSRARGGGRCLTMPLLRDPFAG